MESVSSAASNTVTADNTAYTGTANTSKVMTDDSAALNGEEIVGKGDSKEGKVASVESNNFNSGCDACSAVGAVDVSLRYRSHDDLSPDIALRYVLYII